MVLPAPEFRAMDSKQGDPERRGIQLGLKDGWDLERWVREKVRGIGERLEQRCGGGRAQINVNSNNNYYIVIVINNYYYI